MRLKIYRKKYKQNKKHESVHVNLLMLMLLCFKFHTPIRAVMLMSTSCLQVGGDNLLALSGLIAPPSPPPHTHVQKDKSIYYIVEVAH